MNKFDNYITDYLSEHKEVSLEKIGTIKVSGPIPVPDDQATSVTFVHDRKAATSENLISFIAEKAKKNRFLIASDLESHFAQAREFINIGKNYEIPDVGFIKANKSGVYEYIAYSDANKSIRIAPQPVLKPQETSRRSVVQVITLLIVLAILAGLGWEAYQFFAKKKADTTAVVDNTQDTVVAAIPKDTAKVDSSAVTTSEKTYAATDVVNVRYIFETTTLALRAKTRTQQLIGFHNNAGYDSFMNNKTKFYSLYILRTSPISDTLRIRDSLGKFLEKDIKLEIEK